jgi:BON domain
MSGTVMPEGVVMHQTSTVARIERELEAAGLHLIVEQDGGVLRLSGRVGSAEDRQAAEDIVAGLAGGAQIDNAIDVDTILPTTLDDFQADEPDAYPTESLAEAERRGGEVDADFTDQELLTDPIAAAGPSGSADDPVADGDEVYVPPIDPVVRANDQGELEVLGGFSSDSMDEVGVAPSASDAYLGDEAIRDAITRELREDALTTSLEGIRVLVV